MSATACLAASSGKQSTTRSTLRIKLARAAGSLRSSGAMLLTSIPATSATRRRISRPVVPASPSMKIAGLVAPLNWPLGGDLDGAGAAFEAVLVVMEVVPGKLHKKAAPRARPCERQAP